MCVGDVLSRRRMEFGGRVCVFSGTKLGSRTGESPLPRPFFFHLKTITYFLLGRVQESDMSPHVHEPAFYHPYTNPSP